jgi:hypothetical protein
MHRQTPLLKLIAAIALTTTGHAADSPGPISVYERSGEPAVTAGQPGSGTQLGAGAGTADGTTMASADGPDAAAQAERIVAACILGLAKETSISARMRQRVRIGDHSMVGAGLYLQTGLGEEQRFRFESSLAVDSRNQASTSGTFFTVETLEICDGGSFWTYHRWGEKPAEVQRVDIARVRQRVEKITRDPGPDAPAITQHIGGVPRVLAWLREWFLFEKAVPAEIDGMPIWLVEGYWNPIQVARMFPDIADEIDAENRLPPEALPDGVPWSVRISIGKRDLFPFRIEYFAVCGERPVDNPQVETIGVFELFDVRLGEPVDQSVFIYSPASSAIVDTTDLHLGGVFGPRP